MADLPASYLEAHPYRRDHFRPKRLLSSRDGVDFQTRADVLSTSYVGQLLGIPRSIVHELPRRGELPARRVGRRWIFVSDRAAAAIAPLDAPQAWRPEPVAKRVERYSTALLQPTRSNSRPSPENEETPRLRGFL